MVGHEPLDACCRRRSRSVRPRHRFNRDGWFVGGGVENSLNIFGITAPGWFMKTEYRSAFYDRISLPQTLGPAAAPFVGPTGTAVTFKPWNQTISTSLVYRFNWGGPVVAKY